MGDDWKKGGLRRDKYIVVHGDGRPTDPNAHYFVLRLDGTSPHNEASRAAIRAYADVIRDHNPQFATELRAWLGELNES